MLQEVTVFCLRLQSESKVGYPTVWKHSGCHQVAELFFGSHLVEEKLLLELEDHIEISHSVVVTIWTTLENCHESAVDVAVSVSLLEV